MSSRAIDAARTRWVNLEKFIGKRARAAETAGGDAPNAAGNAQWGKAALEADHGKRMERRGDGIVCALRDEWMKAGWGNAGRPGLRRCIPDGERT